MLALRYDNQTSEGDVFYANGTLVRAGFDIDTLVLLSLLLDAPALPGDALPPGTPKRGWWGNRYTGLTQPLGSRLWLLENALVTTQTADRAKGYAEEALAWFVRDRYVRAVDVLAVITDDDSPRVDVFPTLTLKDGNERPFGPFKVTH